jgi:hypothetical protein
MIHVLLRVAVWVLVLGGAYLLFGPELFDSSRQESPFQSETALFLPPAKSQQELVYEELASQRPLNAEESADYQRLLQERQSRFWQREGVSVSEALSGVETQRKAHLAKLLQERGLAPEEAAVFFMVLERDHPQLLADQNP